VQNIHSVAGRVDNSTGHEQLASTPVLVRGLVCVCLSPLRIVDGVDLVFIEPQIHFLDTFDP
jgi:hypothetical protein